MRTRVVKPTRREILLVESRWTGLSCNLGKNNAANAGHAFLNKRNKRREMSRATRGSARQAARRQAAEAAAPEPAAAPAPVSLGEPVTSGIDLTGTWKLDMTSFGCVHNQSVTERRHDRHRAGVVKFEPRAGARNP